MRKLLSIQRGMNQARRVGIICFGWSLEVHSAAPRRGSFGVDAGQDDPSFSHGRFHDGGSSVGILADNVTPAGKLRAVFPVLVEQLSLGRGDRYRRFTDSPKLGSVKTEPNPRSQIQSIVWRVAGEERSGANSQIIQPILYRAANRRGCGGGQAVANDFEISAGDDEQTIFTQLKFADSVQLRRIDCRIGEVLILKNFLNGLNVSG